MWRRSIRVLLCILVAAAGASNSQGPSEVLNQMASDESLSVDVYRLITDSMCAEGPLITLSTTFLRKHSTTKIARLFLFTNKNEALRTQFGKGGADYGYTGWLTKFHSAMTDTGCLAEVLRIGRCAVLRVRDFQGNLMTRHLGPCSPFAIVSTDSHIEILYLTLDRLKYSKSVTPHFYVRSDSPVTQELGRVLAARTMQQFALSRLKLSLRSDEWFVFEERFPLFYPFTAIRSPPSREYLNNHPTVTCFTGDGTVLSCHLGEPIA